jgi:hypothetical protein
VTVKPRKESRLDQIEKDLILFLESMVELRESQKKTDDLFRRTDEKFLELRESQKKTEEQLRRTDEKLDRIGTQLADLGLVQGEVAEDLFYRNVRGVFRKRRMQFKEVLRNLKKKGVAEYDIVAVNGEAVLVVEVKNKLEKRMVDRFLMEKLPKFPEVFPEFRGRKVLGAMGALVVREDVGRYAEKAGLFVLTQTDEGGAALLNKEGFKAKDFS